MGTQVQGPEPAPRSPQEGIRRVMVVSLGLAPAAPAVLHLRHPAAARLISAIDAAKPIDNAEISQMSIAARSYPGH